MGILYSVKLCVKCGVKFTTCNDDKLCGNCRPVTMKAKESARRCRCGK
jgi:hypothetical protein